MDQDGTAEISIGRKESLIHKSDPHGFVKNGVMPPKWPFS